ncbi:hypothetical protein D3C81_1380860 [compost metagenome]
MTRPENRRRKTAQASFTKQPGLDLCLVDTIVTEGVHDGGFIRRYGLQMAVHPDRTAVQKMLNLATERFDQAFGTR